MVLSLGERVWHQPQVEEECKDGSLKLALRVDKLDEVERWVLGFGAHVTVVRPAELTARIRAPPTACESFTSADSGTTKAGSVASRFRLP